MSFKDHFSKQSADYAKFRPKYPRQLFEYLSTIAPSRQLAWDCGTGNGQAAVGLASVFDRVIATDASEKQIANAQAHERVEYRLASAENSGLESTTIDLIMVAQALHWFDLDRFYAEAQRVLKADGVLAASAYLFAQIEPAIDAVLSRYYHGRRAFLGTRAETRRKLRRGPFSVSRNRSTEIRNDRALGSRSSGWLPQNVVFKSAVLRTKRQ
jgi:ubiquinone/menaquinone biosynthesis C-methylase UbiE